ncbi:hypothetical protein M9458_008720, partial [Cirrhinus mrigala]
MNLSNLTCNLDDCLITSYPAGLNTFTRAQSYGDRPRESSPKPSHCVEHQSDPAADESVRGAEESPVHCTSTD